MSWQAMSPAVSYTRRAAAERHASADLGVGRRLALTYKRLLIIHARTMSVAAASSDVFRAVADPTRRAMLDRLREADRSVRELARPFRMSQPAISQHLRVLREAGLVRARQVGRQRLYRINPRPLEALYEWAARYKPLVDPLGPVWA